MSKIKIGITIGDINGIGPEVIIKALSNEHVLQRCTPIIYGSSKVLGYHKNIVDNPSFSFVSSSSAQNISSGKINVVNCWQDAVHITLGKATEDGGKCAYIALDKAVDDLSAGHIDALVTGPVNKHAMKLANFPYLGHTEFIAEKLGGGQASTMMMISDTLKVALVTTHVPISDISQLITKESITQSLHGLNQTLVEDFGYSRPNIAVLGLNPHAGDSGEIGTEDEEIVRPAIIEAKKGGLFVSGPYPADGFFGNYSHRKFDCILAMYHDQGLIPFKLISFADGVNYSSGLNRIRTSPDHGTAYEIAGQNMADETSMREAIYAALDISRTRSDYLETVANPLVTSEKTEEAAASE